MIRFIETIKFECSNRGKLLWITTPNNVRVIGFWNNDHTSCGG